MLSIYAKGDRSRNIRAGVEPSGKHEWMKPCLLQTFGGVLNLHVVRVSKDPCHPLVEFVVAVTIAEKDVHHVRSARIAKRLPAYHAESGRRPGRMMNAIESFLKQRTAIWTILGFLLHSVRALSTLWQYTGLSVHRSMSTRSFVVDGAEMTRKWTSDSEIFFTR
jgi:hypothetical protein